MAPTDEQSKILALEAKLGKMGKQSNKSSSNSGGNTQSSSSNNGKSGKSSKKKKEKKDLPAWVTKWPGKDFVDANQTKVVDGKTYWWCKKHKRFVQHKTSECKKGSSSSGQSGSRGNSSGTGTSNPTTSISNHPSVPSIRVSTATLMDE
jgi:hypothetical protein